MQLQRVLIGNSMDQVSLLQLLLRQEKIEVNLCAGAGGYVLEATPTEMRRIEQAVEEWGKAAANLRRTFSGV